MVGAKTIFGGDPVQHLSASLAIFHAFPLVRGELRSNHMLIGGTGNLGEGVAMVVTFPGGGRKLYDFR